MHTYIRINKTEQYIYIYIYIYIHTYTYMHMLSTERSPAHREGRSADHTRSPLEDSRLFGPSPLKILATTYVQMGS